ncbi:MAG: hypothetical protein QM723_33305 [Myxococcaceae bacterium]
MSGDKVDKKWSEKGLGAYETAQILGTLKHYGIDVDEAGFKAKAADAWPLQLAAEWQSQWKGIGQFKSFPASAVEALWRRWLPEQAQPLDLVEALAQLMQSLIGLRKGDGSQVEAGFSKVEATVKRIPPEGDRRERFVAEVVMVMSSAMQTLDLLAEALAKDAHVTEAGRLVDLEESLFPVRKGVSRALIQAATGEAKAGSDALVQIAQDNGRDDYGRLAAVDALLHLGQPKPALAAVRLLLEKASAAGDGDLFEALHGRLHQLSHGLTEEQDQRALVEAVEKAHRALDQLGRKAH